MIGLDFFLWADTGSLHGLTSLFTTRAIVKSFARQIRRDCGAPPALVPIMQWYRAEAPDYRYEAWFWHGSSHGYIPHGIAFALAPVGTPDTLTVYHCVIDRAPVVDSMLSTSATCEGAPVVQPPTAIGAVYGDEQPGLVPVYRYTQQVWPWDHFYAVAPDAAPGVDYALDGLFGWAHSAWEL